MARSLYAPQGTDSGRHMPARQRKSLNTAFWGGQEVPTFNPTDRTVVGSDRCDHVYLACLMCGSDKELAAYR